jgi:hypothetical protein
MDPLPLMIAKEWLETTLLLWFLLPATLGLLALFSLTHWKR